MCMWGPVGQGLEFVGTPRVLPSDGRKQASSFPWPRRLLSPSHSGNRLPLDSFTRRTAGSIIVFRDSWISPPRLSSGFFTTRCVLGPAAFSVTRRSKIIASWWCRSFWIINHRVNEVVDLSQHKSFHCTFSNMLVFCFLQVQIDEHERLLWDLDRRNKLVQGMIWSGCLWCTLQKDILLGTAVLS